MSGLRQEGEMFLVNHMCAKSFPYPLHVGHDITQIGRVASLFRAHGIPNLIKKIFSPLEWPTVLQRLRQIQLLPGPTAGGSSSEVDLHECWKSINDLRTFHDDQESFEGAFRDERSPLGQLTQFFAGRWAAKEAVIKAIPCRKLSRQSIAIVTPAAAPHLFQPSMMARTKPFALIDPPVREVFMTSAVATDRGLRGFTRETAHHRRGKVEIRGGVGYHLRRSQIAREDRVIAQISISHDGAYASAICMATDSEPEGDSALDPLFDDGKGSPVHEPDWEDLGCFASA